LPRLTDYQPERLADERSDLVYYYTVDTANEPPPLTIESVGTRLRSVIDRDLHHRGLGCITPGDVIEFS
jgi:hypothetical protein